ncbi:MAG: BamA/TamA family outer membrane protein [Kiritimatiellae bacterium]|nr:BamA/TamA family outer membrane protein [Kiritimatiellia bacterium]
MNSIKYVKAEARIALCAALLFAVAFPASAAEPAKGIAPDAAAVARAEKKAAELKAEAEAKARAEAEKKARAEKEAAEKAAKEKAKAEKKAAELKAEAEAKARAEAEKKARAEKEAAEKAAKEKAKAEKKAAELKARQEAEAKEAAEKAAREKAKAEKKAAELKADADRAVAEAKAEEAEARAKAEKKISAAKAAGEKKIADLKAEQAAAAKKAADNLAVLESGQKVAADHKAAAEALAKNARTASVAAASELAAAKAAYDKAVANADSAAKALKAAKSGNARPDALSALKNAAAETRRAQSDALAKLDAASDKASASEKALRRASSALEDADEETARCAEKVAKAKAGMAASAQKAREELAKAEADAAHELSKAKAAGDFAVADAAKSVKAAEAGAADAAKALETAKAEKGEAAVAAAAKDAKDKAEKGGPPAVAAAAKDAKDKAEKGGPAVAAAAKDKAEALPPARVTDAEKALAAAGVTFTGDTDWFTRARAKDGRTLKQVFADAMAANGNDVSKAAAAAQAAARDNGYYICAVGKDDKGAVKVEAGRFSQVDIRFGKENAPDGRWFTSEQIRERLERSLVRSGEPFNYNLLYSQFRDLNANPDLNANIELRLDKADPDARALGVEVNVEEEWPFHAIFGIDNFGTDSVDDKPDEWMARLTLQRLNLWKADHALTLNGYSAIDGTLYGGAGSYYMPFTLLDAREAAVTVHGGYSEVDADEVVKNIGVYGSGWFSGVQASTELLTSLDYSLRIALGLTYRTTEDGLVLHDEKGKNKLDKTSADIVPMSLALMFSNRNLDSLYGRNYLTVESVYNLGDALGCSEAGDFAGQRFAAKDNLDYWLVRAQLARIQTFGGSLTDEGYAGRSIIFAKAEAQYAGGPLIPAEQMGVGGANSVRGYLEREFLGDHAVAATLEYRTPLLLGLLTRPPKDSDRPASDRLQFVVFSDLGFFSREDELPGETNDEVLWGAGVGLRFAWSENYQLRCDVATPLKDTRESEPGKDIRYHVSAQCQF